MKRPLFKIQLCFLVCCFLTQIAFGQGYFNSFYGEEFEGVLLANLIVHDEDLVISGGAGENLVRHYLQQ